MKKSVWLVVKIGITLTLVYLLIRHVDWHLVVQELWTLSWWLVALYVVLQFVSIVLSVRKWQVIAESKAIHFGFRDGMFTYLSGMFINNFLPSTIGGDIYRSLWLSRKTDSRLKAFSTVVFDRFTGLWMTALLALVGSIFLWDHLWESAILQISYLVLIGFFAADIMIGFLYRRPWFSRLVELIPLEKLRHLIQELMHYTKPDIWIQAGWWSFLFVLMGLGLSNYVLFLALGYTLPLLPFLALSFLMALYVGLPISINNIGLKEWAYVALFGLLGISLEVAVTAALLSRIIQMFISFAALPVYITERQKTLIPLPPRPEKVPAQ